MKFDKKLKYTKPFKINITKVKYNNKTNYLGVTLNTHLQFNAHIAEIMSNARKTRAALLPILHNKNPIPIRTKISIIYKLYIKSKITYSVLTWGAQISSTNWKKSK